jgi:hypothetical protein
MKDAFAFEDAYIEHYRLSPLARLARKTEKQLSIIGKTMMDLNSLVIFAKVVEANSTYGFVGEARQIVDTALSDS